MFSQQYLPYIQGVSQLHLKGAGVDEKSRLVAIAVALAVSQALPLPSDSVPVDDVRRMFGEQHRIGVTSAIGRFNEAAVLDLQYAVEMAGKFWMLRVNASRRILPSIVLEGDDFLKSWLGINTAISQEDQDLMNKHARELFVLVTCCSEVYECVCAGALKAA